jgi:hypothetical protein
VGHGCKESADNQWRAVLLWLFAFGFQYVMRTVCRDGWMKANSSYALLLGMID